MQHELVYSMNATLFTRECQGVYIWMPSGAEGLLWPGMACAIPKGPKKNFIPPIFQPSPCIREAKSQLLASDSPRPELPCPLRGSEPYPSRTPAPVVRLRHSASPPRPPAPPRRPRRLGPRRCRVAASATRAQAVPVRPRPASPSSTPRLGPGLAALEGTERALFEKKRRIRQALEEGKPIRPSPPSSATRSTSCGGRSTSRTSSFRPSGKRELVRRVRCQFLLSFFSFETSGSMYA